MPDYENRIFEGRMEDALAALPAGIADLILTDPPYGVSYKNNFRTEMHAELANDGWDEFVLALPSWLAAMHRSLKPDGTLVMFIGGGGRTPGTAYATLAACAAGWRLQQTLVWDKRTPGLGWRYRPAYENALVLTKTREIERWYDRTNRVGNVLRHGRHGGSDIEEHPTMKPVGLLRELIGLHTKPGEVVLDPFAGSGSTLVAASQTGRVFVGVELEPRFVALAQRRLEREGVVREVGLTSYIATQDL